MVESETISAVATPPGFGGVGIVRVSGPLAADVSRAILKQLPLSRHALFSNFYGQDGEPIDQGIALFFPSPDSFTGEDVLELQGHGGPVVMDQILRRTLELGARIARPGEFSERSFLNGKLDLAQAEAVADLIESATVAAARLAGRTLRGEFSRRVRELTEQLTHLRIFIEAAMDFPEEEIDFLTNPRLSTDLLTLVDKTRLLIASARQGQLVREGLTLVIAGPPNVGKSSLLNGLSGFDAAIVTDIPGTTRDLLRQEIQIDGMPLHIIDTAGLRHSVDPVELEGIRRAQREIERADRILWVFDGVANPGQDDFDSAVLPKNVPVTFIRNKIDLTNISAGLRVTEIGEEIALSARTGAGVESLRSHLKQVAGFHGSVEGEFIARTRHTDALNRAHAFMRSAAETLERTVAGELMAEDLRNAQQALGEITGEFTSEDLLGRIFSSFCIGK